MSIVSEIATCYPTFIGETSYAQSNLRLLLPEWACRECRMDAEAVRLYGDGFRCKFVHETARRDPLFIKFTAVKKVAGRSLYRIHPCRQMPTGGSRIWDSVVLHMKRHGRRGAKNECHSGWTRLVVFRYNTRITVQYSYSAPSEILRRLDVPSCSVIRSFRTGMAYSSVAVRKSC